MIRTNLMGRLALVAALAVFGAADGLAQATISGRVVDAELEEPLIGASVVIAGTTQGAATDIDGSYTIENVAPGAYVLQVSYIGFETVSQPVTVAEGDVTVDFRVAAINQALEAIEVFASRAIDRKTPVAYSNVEKVQIQRALGSRDVPLVLNTTPSVYATNQGGGAGDARINVRGFNQRNTAVMINGVPVNDMENGWVYWSNWDGVGDVTTSIQLQRGLAAVNLATPSIGGTLNIITDPAAQERGGLVKQEVGNDNFLKTTVSLSTGLLNNKLAFTALGVRKTGDGLVSGTWTDAWAYYAAGSYQINDRHRLDLFAVGAPQRHGQNLYRQNLAVYDQDYARELFDEDVLALDLDGNGTPDVFDRYSEAGRTYNQNWSPVSESYGGEQAVGGSTFARQRAGFLNERENFYHKPQVNLNWYAQLTDRALLSTVAYYSGGTGGGTGTLGSLRWDYSGPSRVVDWDATIQRNAESEAGATGILRNSRNNQWTLGAISKATIDVAPGLVTELGVDWRTARIEHYREVRDLLGGAYFMDDSNDFWSADEQRRGLGDKVDYFNENRVGWVGAFAQAEVEQGRFTAFGMGGVSSISYTFEDFFKDDGTGNPLVLETGSIWGYQVKGGALYTVTDAADVYANLGYISKVPIFDGVVDDGAGVLNPDPQNETFTSVELGANLRTATAALKLSAYSTLWQDRTVTRNVQLASGDEGLVNLGGVNALHQGVEVEATWRPLDLVRLDAGTSIGDWYYTDDATGFFRPDLGADERVEYSYYIDGLKVGDAPQTQVYYGATVYPVDGLYAQLLGRSYDRYYSDFDPLSRTDPDDRAQSWRVPAYSLFELHVGYDLPLRNVPFDVELRGHVFNLLDQTYVQDATDNSRFNAFTLEDADGTLVNGVDHRADDAEVFLGLPRTFNLGLRATF